MRIDRDNPKCDRAYKLRLQGLEPAVIAERLGISKSQISTVISAGKKRHRAKVKEAAE